MRRLLIIINLFLFINANSQTLGGNTVFNFLKLPQSTRVAALGGINISHDVNDVSLALANPALLQAAMHTQLATSFNKLYAGINAYSIAGAYHHPTLKTNFLAGLQYVDYGSITATDPAGNIYGDLRPVDWTIQLSASRSYLERWHYGATVKYISSSYGQYQANGIAVDVGLLYKDSSNLFSASVLAKNMGTQIRSYAGTEPGDLPFDLQIGLTKRLSNSFLGFSITAHHLHEFDISYNDTEFNNANEYVNTSNNKFTADKLFRHVVAAVDVYVGEYVQVSTGYNHLRRKELNIGNVGGNGLNGFSMGVSLLLEKLRINYARSQYQGNVSYNQFGLTMKLNEYFGLGEWGKRIGW